MAGTHDLEIHTAGVQAEDVLVVFGPHGVGIVLNARSVERLPAQAHADIGIRQVTRKSRTGHLRFSDVKDGEAGQISICDQFAGSCKVMSTDRDSCRYVAAHVRTVLR